MPFVYIGPLSPASFTGFEFGGVAALSDQPSQWKRVSSITRASAAGASAARDY